MIFGGHQRSIRGLKAKKMTNRKIYHSELFVQGIFGTLN